jgi:hypothetical protein
MRGRANAQGIVRSSARHARFWEVRLCRVRWYHLAAILFVSGLWSAGAADAPAAIPATEDAPANPPTDDSAESHALKNVLPPDKWRRLEESVDHALSWIAAQQSADGSFPSTDQAQPAVTSLCVLAFLSRGHQAGVGPYGDQINRAVDYVLACQQPDGVFSKLIPEQGNGRGFTAAQRSGGYNHPFAGLMLGEVYGQLTGEREEKVKSAIEKALVYSRALQTRPNKPVGQEGGFRYLNIDSSDLSCTVCELMFLRSAKNAEFDVPQEYIDDAMAYVRRSADANTGYFYYQPTQTSQRLTNANGTVFFSGGGGVAVPSRGIIAGGIVSLSMGGQHQTDIAIAGGDYLMAHPVTEYGEQQGAEHFFYTCYYYSQAAAFLGGHYWDGLFPPLADAFIDAQSPDGSWQSEPNNGDRVYGAALSTSMAVLTLTTPFELLPIYQR